MLEIEEKLESQIVKSDPTHPLVRTLQKAKKITLPQPEFTNIPLPKFAPKKIEETKTTVQSTNPLKRDLEKAPSETTKKPTPAPKIVLPKESKPPSKQDPKKPKK